MGKELLLFGKSLLLKKFRKLFRGRERERGGAEERRKKFRGNDS